MSNFTTTATMDNTTLNPNLLLTDSAILLPDFVMGGLRNCTVLGDYFLNPAYTIPPVALAAIANILLFYSTHTGRKKLQRHSYFYFCVVNTLISNMLLLTMIMWNLSVYHYGFLDSVNDMKLNPSIGHRKNVS